MPNQSFVHLHVHTHYSLLDGACKVPELVKRCKSLGMNSLAISDHGCMFGAIEFYNECRKHDIKPIIGMEAYMAPGDRRERSTPGGNAGEAAFHLLLLAKNLDGYKNLVKLASTAYRDGFYYKPRIDKEVLREYSKGLIATSACLGGEIPAAFLKRDAKTAKRIAETYLEIFEPDHFFIEVQKQGIAEQDMVNPELVELAKKLGCGTVATNDVHFLTADDHFAHDVLCCISMGRQVSDESRLKYPQHLYLKSPQEMTEALKDFPEAIKNTMRIAEMCDLQLPFGKAHAPVYRVPKERLDEQYEDRWPLGSAEDEKYLRQLCEEGLIWRYGTRDVSQGIRKRLEKELQVIAGKNFCSYFLIVWDFCKYARENGIPVGARGSGVGTMVGYLLGLSNVDPIRYGLLFERFMDPSRSEMPDIDIDICQEGRQKVIEYVRQKYGHVAQIITFGTLAARAACKDVGRVLGVPLAEVDKITKLIPGTPGMTLKRALEGELNEKNERVETELAKLYESNPTAKKVIDLAQKLEGLCRNAGVHAAGVIISDQPLDEIIPLCTDKDDNLLTQFEGGISEKCGLLKMDFLGLRTLTTLQRSIDLEYETRSHREGSKENVILSAAKSLGPLKSGRDPEILRCAQDDNPLNPEPRTLNPGIPDGKIDIEQIDFSDRKVLDLFCRGETKGIFQFESGGMQDLLMKMQPDRLEDLIAANALYRPGPMELIPLYCNRKHGRERVPQEHPIMDQILAETYAIMVYQEQVMQIFNQLGGIELASAYKLIKAISKKQSDVIAKFKPEFIRGCAEKGVEQSRAQDIFELILKFGGYGFNKSHSTRYAIIAFQTAYMKTYHPVEYMAALLTFEMGNTDKVVEYIEECRRMTLPNRGRGIKVLPPDVNVSAKDFTPVYVEEEGTKEGVIRFGLVAVRGVGEKAVEAIVEEREARGPFSSLFEFCERIDMRVVARATIDALVKCGAFASISPNRAPLLAVLDRAVEMGQQTQQDKRMGQLNMFGGGGSAARLPRHDVLPNIPEISNAELLKFEKELLGFYITSHPLTEHQAAIERYSTSSTKEALTRAEGTEVFFGAMITRVKKSITKNGRSAGMSMAMISLEDLEGQIDGVIFAEDFARLSKHPDGLIAPEQIVFVRGKIDRRRETPSIIVSDVLPISQALAKLTTNIGVKLDPLRPQADMLDRFRGILKSHAGRKELYVQVQTQTGQKVSIRMNGELGVRISQQLVDDLEDLLGESSVQLGGEGLNRIKRIQQQQLFTEATTASDAEVIEQPVDAEPDL